MKLRNIILVNDILTFCSLFEFLHFSIFQFFLDGVGRDRKSRTIKAPANTPFAVRVNKRLTTGVFDNSGRASDHIYL